VLHDGSTSRRRDATLRFYGDGSVRLSAKDLERSFTFQDVHIPSRLGNTPRRLLLPDGAELETPDNDAVDAVLAALGRGRVDWVHRQESRLPVVLLATALVLAFGGVFVVYGVPTIARHAAFALSPELTARLGQGTLDVLDQTFQPTGLPEPRREVLRERFLEIVAGAEAGYDYRIAFRRGGMIGANAFALPSGTVVVTDELVELAQDDEEIVAVLAHEVGHVVHRHGLRQAIQSSMLAIGIVLVTGDLSSTSGFVAALPALLAETRYSRDFEREADDFARVQLEAEDIEPCRLGAILQRMQRSGGADVEVPFLSTHPATEERVKALGGPCEDEGEGADAA
jgi:Zn-dependent protease with chaperone function